MSPAALLALLLAGSFPADAQGPATIRGVVYSCGTGDVVPDARVELRALDGGRLAVLTADAHGRFARVGIEPGRYLVVATPSLQNVRPWNQRALWTPREIVSAEQHTASRLASLEADDVLDVRIGTPSVGYVGGVVYTGDYWTKRAAEYAARPQNEPHPACDPPIVPMAVATADRYMIH